MKRDAGRQQKKQKKQDVWMITKKTTGEQTEKKGSRDEGEKIRCAAVIWSV